MKATISDVEARSIYRQAMEVAEDCEGSAWRDAVIAEVRAVISAPTLI